MPTVLFLFLLCSLLAAALHSPAESQKLTLPIADPELKKIPIAVSDFVSENPGPVNGRDLSAIIKHDLHLTALFQIIEPPAPITMTANGEPDFDRWSQNGVQALITGSFQITGSELTLEVKLYDVVMKKLQIGKRYSGRINDQRRMIHRFGDRVMEQLTGTPGCFSTKIAFVGEAPSREVFIMDFDGQGLAQVTRNGSINLSPDWSPDGRSIVFMSYLNGNPDAVAMDLSNLSLRPVSPRPGLNASPRVLTR